MEVLGVIYPVASLKYFASEQIEKQIYERILFSVI